jgi:hypothetical protein
VRCELGDHQVLILPIDIDIHAAWDDKLLDHGDTDIQVSNGLYLHHRPVRRRFFTFVMTLNVVDDLIAWTRSSKEVVAQPQLGMAGGC